MAAMSSRRSRFVPAPEAFTGLPEPAVGLVAMVLSGGLGGHKWHDRHVLPGTSPGPWFGARRALVFVDEDGDVLETEHANIFAVFGGVVRTPPLDGRILAGTTRETVIRLALFAGLEVSRSPSGSGELDLGR